jgi:hypothetical protein
LITTPPTSSSSSARQALASSLVMTPRLQPETRGVRALDRLVEPGEARHHDYRRKRFLAADLGLDRHVGEHRRREGLAPRQPAHEHLSDEGERGVDPALRAPCSEGIDDRPKLGRRVERVTHAQCGGAGGETVKELLRDRLVQQQPLDADAQLAGELEGAGEAARCGPIDVGGEASGMTSPYIRSASSAASRKASAVLSASISESRIGLPISRVSVRASSSRRARTPALIRRSRPPRS